MSTHEHKVKRWSMGEYPVTGRCECGYALIANGGGWVTPQEAERLKKSLGIRGAL